MKELKPCPFCGGKAEYVIQGFYGRIRCKNCGNIGIGFNIDTSDYSHNAEALAIAAWNTRPSDKICPEIMALAKTMQYKLDKNGNKECDVMNPDGTGRGWSHCDTDWLAERIQDELDELNRALDSANWHPVIEDYNAVLNECADVANFAMMIHDMTSKAMPIPELPGGEG